MAAITNGENAVNVLGQTTFTTSTGATTQTGLKNPVGLSLDSTRGWLFVADYSNHRAMVFDVNTIANGEAAINVLGQSSFATSTAATTQSGLRNPSGAAFDSGTSRLFVADTNNHRVMVFDVAAIANGQNATKISNGENATGVLGQANFTSGSAATAQNRMSSPRGVSLVTVLTSTASIAYDYDPLYRLTAADYDNGTFFHYTYDAVGNRQTEVTQAGTTTYGYDLANRLTSVNGVTYTWDNNGNLLNDGASTYTYTHANRLASVVQGANTYTFSYNGLGDRLRQTINGSPTNYTVDLAAGLTQVLADGTNSYLYGLARIGEEQPGGWQYHLGDALGSVRQLANSAAAVTLARGYEPFGDTLTSAGSTSTAFQFTGEQRDATGLTYLRARYLEHGTGRFLTADILEGVPSRPTTLHPWSYAANNATNIVDPSGLVGVRIWVAAFIKDPAVIFPYFYVGESSFWHEPILSFDPTASHKGDNRGFYEGYRGSGLAPKLPRPSSRIWHDILLDIESGGVSVLSNMAGTGVTEVTYFDVYRRMTLTVTGKAPSPNRAQISSVGCITTVSMEAQAGEPVSPPGITPPIRYEYSIRFDACRGEVSYSGKHSQFPSHELHLSGLPETSQALQHSAVGTPWDLFRGANTSLPWIRRGYPPLLNEISASESIELLARLNALPSSTFDLASLAFCGQ